MPNRIIKESIRTSKSINQLTDFQFRLWTYLITYVDDFGRGSADPEILKGFIFPRRNRVTEADIKNALNKMAGIGCILLYRIDGESYLCFPRWCDHQQTRSQKSKFPEPTQESLVSCLSADCEQKTSNDSICKQMISDDINCNQLQADDIRFPRNRDRDRDRNRDREDIARTGEPCDDPPCKTDPELLFERFWAVYPVKKAKDSAKKAFFKRKPDEQLVEAMISAIDEQKKTRQWQEGFIPHPATWLNRGEWLNEKSPMVDKNKSGMAEETFTLEDIEKLYWQPPTEG